MKNRAIIFSIILSFAFCLKSISMPVYTDDIPQEYINKVKSQKKTNYLQSFPAYDTDKAIEVKIYSPKTIEVKIKPRPVGYYCEYEVLYPKINDTLEFLVAEDVYKNNKLLIKKDTPAIGIVRESIVSMTHHGAPSEMQISMFKTKDINRNTIVLYGTVQNETSGYGPVLLPNIRKNKVYTLYYK